MKKGAICFPGSIETAAEAALASARSRSGVGSEATLKRQADLRAKNVTASQGNGTRRRQTRGDPRRRSRPRIR